MTAANPWRGDIAIMIGRQNHVLRPSFAALALIESEIAPLLLLAQKAADGAVRIEDMAVVFRHCLHPFGAETHPDTAVIGEAIVSMGLAEAVGVYRRLLEAVLKGVGHAP